MKIRTVLAMVFVTSAIGISGCGDDDAPGAAVRQTTGGTAAEDPRNVYVEMSPPESLLTSEDCPAVPYRFRVRADGTFTAGPCETGGQPVNGTITPEELTQLNQLTEAVTASDLTAAPVCAPIGLPIPTTIDLTVGAGVTHRLFDADEQETCVKGNADAVGDLGDYVIDTLAEKYYPKPNAAAQPTPGPSATATPEPTSTANPILPPQGI